MLGAARPKRRRDTGDGEQSCTDTCDDAGRDAQTAEGVRGRAEHFIRPGAGRGLPPDAGAQLGDGVPDALVQLV